MGEMKRRAQNHADKKETIHMCLGCNKEVTGDDEGDSQHRIARHLSDVSANEAIYYEDEPAKQIHVSANFWRQIVATYKKDTLAWRRRAGYQDGGPGSSGNRGKAGGRR